MTLRKAIESHIENELNFTGSIFFVPFKSTKDEGILILDQGETERDPTRIRSNPRIQILIRFASSEECRQWGETFFRAYDTGRPLQLTPTFRVGRCRTAGPPRSLGPDGVGLYRRTLDLEISMRYGAEI